MQILCVYQHHKNTMIEFDYLENSLTRYISGSTLWLDPVPIIPREPAYQVKPYR